MSADCLASNFVHVDAVNGCYRAEFSNRLSWSDAANSCNSLHNNAHLVAINNAAEQTALLNLLKSNTAGDHFNVSIRFTCSFYRASAYCC